MFEDLIARLDEMGVDYTEDAENGSLSIDISSVDKTTLVDIIIALNDAGEMFDITDTEITVQGTGSETAGEELAQGEEEVSQGEDYINQALGQLQ